MSYFDTTVFNRIAQQQKETNELLRELIKTLQEQKSKGQYPTQNSEPTTAPATQQPEGNVVAYLDVGTNGYLDLGSELSEDALQQLPKGRHALVIAGTYGIDGYTAASTPQSAPAGVLEDAARWHWMAEYIVGTRTDLDDDLVASATVDELRKLVDADLATRKQGEKHDR